MLNGRTTLELRERKIVKKSELGKFGNLKTVLGNNVLLWPFPIGNQF